MAATDLASGFWEMAAFAAAIIFTLIVVKPAQNSPVWKIWKVWKVWKETRHRFRPFTLAPERPLVSNLKYSPDMVRFLRRTGAFDVSCWRVCSLCIRVCLKHFSEHVSQTAGSLHSLATFKRLRICIRCAVCIICPEAMSRSVANASFLPR